MTEDTFWPNLPLPAVAKAELLLSTTCVLQRSNHDAFCIFSHHHHLDLLWSLGHWRILHETGQPACSMSAASAFSEQPAATACVISICDPLLVIIVISILYFP